MTELTVRNCISAPSNMKWNKHPLLKQALMAKLELSAIAVYLTFFGLREFAFLAVWNKAKNKLNHRCRFSRRALICLSGIHSSSLVSCGERWQLPLNVVGNIPMSFKKTFGCICRDQDFTASVRQHLGWFRHQEDAVQSCGVFVAKNVEKHCIRWNCTNETSFRKKVCKKLPPFPPAFKRFSCAF